MNFGTLRESHGPLNSARSALCSWQPILQCLAQRFDRCGLAEFADLLISHNVLKPHMSADCANHL